MLLKLFFREAPLKIKLKDEEIDYLNGKYEFLNTNIQFMDVAKLKKFVSTFNLYFMNLVKPNSQSQEFYNYCLVNKRFVISADNLKVVLGEDFTKKPMTTILGIANERLKKYLVNNQKLIVKMFTDTCVEEDRSALVYMIKEKVAEESWLVTYIGNQQLIFDNIGDLDKAA